MCTEIVFTLCSLLLGFANSASTYDQRQSGALNVQVDLKDLKIIALMKGGKEEYVDYDYAYDYSEMTIKPQNGTTPKPLNGTGVTGADVAYNATETAMITEHTTLPIKNNNSQSSDTEVTWISAFNDSTTTIRSLDVTIGMGTSHLINDKNVTSTPTPPSSTNCKKGYMMNSNGGCEFKLNGPGNALLKLVKLSQKLKLRREDKRNPGDSV